MMRPHTLFVVAKGFGTCAFEFPRPLLAQGEYELGDITLDRETHRPHQAGQHLMALSGRTYPP